MMNKIKVILTGFSSWGVLFLSLSWPIFIIYLILNMFTVKTEQEQMRYMLEDSMSMQLHEMREQCFSLHDSILDQKARIDTIENMFIEFMKREIK